MDPFISIFLLCVSSFSGSVLVIFFSSNLCIVLFVEAHRALELLEDYHSRLAAPQDRTLRIAIERVIRIFKSRLFQALLGKYKHHISFEKLLSIFNLSALNTK